MQQTSKYQFNLVENSDDFSPTPLNQNMEKVEDALEAHAAQVAAQLEEMEGSIGSVSDSVAQVAAALGSGGHTCRIACGSYAGTGQSGASRKTTLSCDFYPVALLVQYDLLSSFSQGGVFCIRGISKVVTNTQAAQGLTVSWSDTGVSYYGASAMNQFNQSGTTYYYILLGYSPEE